MHPAQAIVARAEPLFRQVFHAEPTHAAIAPGRVELLGNHTDYNGGLVISAAIDRHTAVVGRKVPGSSECPARFQVHASDYGKTESFTPDPTVVPPFEVGSWPRFCWELVLEMAGPLKQKSGLEGPVSGLPSGRYEVLIHGDLPIGAGLSSSASLEAASALWLAEIGAADGGDAPPRWDDSARFDLARKLCALEARAAGVACGLLDQFSVLLGAQDHALWLDCATLQYGRLPLGEPAPCLVVCDTKTSRRLAEGMYNARRAECEFVLSHFQARNPGASPVSLRGVAQVDLERDWADLDPVARLRARHVITEIERVRRGIAMLQAGNTTAFAQLMGDSHRSSRDDFGNSSPALDAMYESACGAPGFLGGKLSGAGWAGCTVNLVEPARSIEFERHVRAKYREATGREPDIWTCRASEGARAWRLS